VKKKEREKRDKKEKNKKERKREEKERVERKRKRCGTAWLGNPLLLSSQLLPVELWGVGGE
jgi:hypothetical protein